MNKRRRKLILYAFLSWPVHTTAYVIAPVVVSGIGVRHGWRDGLPGAFNVVGAIPVLAGAVLTVWAVISHYRATDEVAAKLVPEYLATNGPYGRSRNPLYVAGAAMWLGWALVFGSVAVLCVALALWVGIVGLGVPFEERMLRRRFGADYERYLRETHRWWGRSAT